MSEETSLPDMTFNSEISKSNPQYIKENQTNFNSKNNLDEIKPDVIHVSSELENEPVCSTAKIIEPELEIDKDEINKIPENIQTGNDEHIESQPHGENQDINFENLFDNLNPSQLRKRKLIINAILANDVDYLKVAAIEEGGLISDQLRQMAWPKLIGVNIHDTFSRPSKEKVESHPYYNQVLLDVNRSLKRFPPSIKEKQRLAMQDQLVLLIMRVLTKHPTFHYYQGYHDICVTFLLVLGEEMSFHVVERLSATHLNVFMKKTMEPTIEMLHYIYPIIFKENPILYRFLEKSEAGVVFALSWLITWFGHVLNKYSDVVRLCDFFMVSGVYMPVYLSACIVLYREVEILSQDCDMASVHSLLLNLPEDLPFEKLIKKSIRLYNTYPPESLKTYVKDLLEKRRQLLSVNRKPLKWGLLSYIFQTVKGHVLKRKASISFAFAIVVLISGIMYQSYKNNA